MNEKRNCMISRTSALPLIFISVFFHFALGSLEFHFIDQSKSYSEAKTYCRQRYTDLATVESLADMNTLLDLFLTTGDTAWIGLEIGNQFNWHWSRADENTDYFNWEKEETQTLNSEKCAAMSQNGSWLVSDCGDEKSFICHANSDASSNMFIAEAKSWRQAQSDCRSLSSDLVSIHSAEENAADSLLSRSQTVWIGLFGDPWKWSSGSNSSFRLWKPNQPNYVNSQQCVVTELKDGGKWNNRNCNAKFSFICQKELGSTPASTRPQTTQSKSTSQQLPTNLTTPQQNSPQFATKTFYYEKSSTVHLDITNVTGSTPQHSVTASPTGMGTLSQATMQSNTVTSQMNSSFMNSEKLILIKRNLTWIEALAYCQKHHVDLVLIDSKDTQDKVAAKVKNATSQYVWLGLCYSCTFKFWFWIGTTPSCYQNWMPGQGPEMVYECGTRGAVEATGRQQWTGLAETEEMNFICSENGG
uniref:Si:dkey-83f18.8 n=1 Tax=Oryzias latipes TaxID=8090 RepID=A0A3P9L4G3_ORYLA